MNMQGIIEPVDLDKPDRPPVWEKSAQWVWRNRVFLTVVVIPSLLLAAYLFLVASDQYESEAHFFVRSADQSSTPTGGVSQVLSLAGGGQNQNEAMSVADYLTSHDAVQTLRREDRLVQRYHTPKADIVSRLWSADPTPESLLKYYRSQISVQYNTDTGITVLTVHAFTPTDSYQLARKLLQLGEARVNELNSRSYADAVTLSQKQLTAAEEALAANQERMMSFRQSRSDIDPTASGQAQLGLVTALRQQLAVAQAQLSAMAGSIYPSSPQYRALSARVAALRAQVATQSARLAGTDNAIAADIGGYESLKLRQQFLAKRYEAAAAALQRAREQAVRQQLYVIRVVDANMPVKSLFPQRGRILLTAVVALMLIYSIGWLIAAGVKEHAA